MSDRRLVLLESPYAGDLIKNIAYARACLLDSLKRGESPIASHLLYTQPGVLRDDYIEERNLGIEAGLAWLSVVQASVIYTDLGISAGMKKGILRARALEVPIIYRRLEKTDEEKSLWP